MERKQPKDSENSYLIIAKHDAVVSELVNCSRIGIDVLKEGGSAVDVTELCVANKRMFVKNPTSASIGGLSVSVLRDGDIRLKMFRNELEQDPALLAIYAPSGKLLEKGEIVYRRNFSRTLELISENYTEFYEGSIARSLIKEINGRGGIMSCDDFKNYKTIIREPVIGYYHDYYNVGTHKWSFPHIYAKFVGKYEISNNGLDITNLRRIVETIKFGFARRTELGDPEYLWFELMFLIIKHSIWTIITQYLIIRMIDHGTTHISVMDKNDMAVSFTSTVCAPNHFGLWPFPYNFAFPTIVENESGKVELVTGGSGGSKILSAVLQSKY
ncbi:gamma-glutamyltranspeptidase [Gigaspora margarita]|uniref:Gamma-glutamyltranspeptidase n=1 Tax=Gigaspora margarita TaxID=4874 RepID=A0A8H3XA47_GIGMA|nr:gamma-glutamyltranspeptidase [Gigaspora margarita]